MTLWYEESKLDDVSSAILERYADIVDTNPSLLQPYTDTLQAALGLPDGSELSCINLDLI